MSLIFKNGKMYGGNDVAANPTLTPSTRDLGSISIDGVTYNVGGNTGTAYKETVLWEGSETTNAWANPIVLQNIDIGAYDQLIVEVNGGQHIISAKQIQFGDSSGNNTMAVSGYLSSSSADDLRTIYLNKDLNNVFRIFTTTGKSITVTKVVGIKTGVGGGATSADWELLASVTGSEVVDISNYYARADEFNIVLKVDGYDDQVLTTTFPKSAIPESNGRISLGRNYYDALVKVSPASIQLYQCRGNSSENVLSTTTMDVYYRKSGAQICFGFIDTTNVIVPQTNYTGTMSYTATQDCWVVLDMYATNGVSDAYIDGVRIGVIYSNANTSSSTTIPLRKGQTLSVTADDLGWYIVYGIARGSEVPAYDLVRGNVYGGFIDINRVIQTIQVASGSDWEYTATEDCWATINPWNSSNSTPTKIYLDGVNIIAVYNARPQYPLYIRKGQVLRIESRTDYTYGTIYGLSYGTQNIFAPQIYSLTEREVGTWIDNKPLYAKTVNITAYPSNTTAVNIPHGIADIDTVAHFEAHARWSNGAMVVVPNAQVNNGSIIDSASFDCNVNKTNITLRVGTNRSSISGEVTIYYTKTTDTAGSGQYNTLGVPTVHYSTDEQVIGTWIDGKPVYMRTFDLGSDIQVPYNTFINTTIDAVDKKVIIDAFGIYSTGQTFYPLVANINNGIVRLQACRDNQVALVQYVTIKYTKITD